jgi:hypothetical protein
VLYHSQEEVAQRLVNGTPGQKDYRAMSVFTRFYSRPVYHFLIPKEKYFPVPGVDGALVTFLLRPEGKRPNVPSERRFIKMVRLHARWGGEESVGMRWGSGVCKVEGRRGCMWAGGGGRRGSWGEG